MKVIKGNRYLVKRKNLFKWQKNKYLSGFSQWTLKAKWRKDGIIFRTRRDASEIFHYGFTSRKWEIEEIEVVDRYESY